MGTHGLRVELEEERDFLLRSLDDLEAERAGGDLEEDDYRSLQGDYTARAATVLRRLQHLEEPAEAAPAGGKAPCDGRVDGPAAGPADHSGSPDAHSGSPDGGHGSPDDGHGNPPVETGHVDAGASPARSTSGRRRTRWPLVLSVVATIALAAGSGYLVTRSSGERRPDQGVSGGPDSSPSALLREAITLDNGGKLLDAAKLYDAVLAKEPENVIALTRRGWLVGLSGRQAGNVELLQAGLGYLDRAVKIDPSYADAHAYRGLVIGALGRPGDAGCEFRLWLAVAPPDDERRPAIEGVLDEATTQAGGKLPECPKPPLPGPVAVPPVPPPAPPTAASPSTTIP